MKRQTILITGSTDGIGKLAALQLLSLGHRVIFHGRSAQKLAEIKSSLGVLEAKDAAFIKSDLSQFSGVKELVSEIEGIGWTLDTLVNNAGVFKVKESITTDGLDVRFMVNTVAPYLLIRLLLKKHRIKDRIINLSSAAQSSLQNYDFIGNPNDSESTLYAKSKLAITMWSKSLAEELSAASISVIALNPASFLGSKMVKDAYGVEGNDINIGADIIVRSCLDDGFKSASGEYFDNDVGEFTQAHEDVYNHAKRSQLLSALDHLVSTHVG